MLQKILKLKMESCATGTLYWSFVTVFIKALLCLICHTFSLFISTRSKPIFLLCAIFCSCLVNKIWYVQPPFVLNTPFSGRNADRMLKTAASASMEHSTSRCYWGAHHTGFGSFCRLFRAQMRGSKHTGWLRCARRVHSKGCQALLCTV